MTISQKNSPKSTGFAGSPAGSGFALPSIAMDPPALPSGEGSIQGMGETVGHDAFTGGLNFSMPLPLPEARGLKPSLALTYDAVAGNGSLGVGFTVSVPRISLKTLRVPRYDGHDVYLSANGAVLVAVEGSTTVQRGDGGASYDVTRYRPSRDEDFSLIERWVRQSDGDVHWRITDTSNLVSLFGRNLQSRIADPDAPQRVFAWLLEEQCDSRGNLAAYEYKAEDGIGIATNPVYAGRDIRAQRYLSAVRYGQRPGTATGPDYAFSVLFDYGEYDPSPSNPTPAKPIQPWSMRPDPFSTYRPGFELRTWRRCANILITHYFPAELGPDPVLTKVIGLSYGLENGLSRLMHVTETGWRHTGANALTLTKPPLRFAWTKAPDGPREFQPVVIEAGASFGADIATRPSTLVDLDGDGLPGLLVSTPSQLLYWRNQGGGSFAAPVSPSTMPALRDLDSAQLRLASIDRFGRLDLVVETPQAAGYFPNRGDGVWGEFTPFQGRAMQVFEPDSQRVDLSGAGTSDVLSITRDSVSWTLARATRGYGETRIKANSDQLPSALAPPGTTLTTFANMFGDGLAHLVQAGPGNMTIWPNLGYGVFGDPVLMDNMPDLANVAPDRMHFVDTTGTGMADLLVIGEGKITIFENLAGNSFAAPVTITLPAPFETIDTVDFGDILATGTQAIILTAATGENRHSYYDFTASIRTGVLSSIDNGRGGLISVAWRASTQYQLDDARAGRPWVTQVPFPVQVVASITREDRIANSRSISRFAYHDAYYDPFLFAFRGFGSVDIWDAENFDISAKTPDGVAFAPPALSRQWYLNGAYEEWPLLQAKWQGEFFTGDTPQIPIPEMVLALGAKGTSGTVQRQAYSALAGSLVRKEIYGEDASPEAGIPYTVEMASTTVSLLQAPRGDSYGIFTTLQDQTAQLDYERERQDQRTTQNLTLERDAWGQPLLEVTLAYPRQDKAVALSQQLLLRASAEVAAYAVPQDGSYLHNQQSQRQMFELSGLTPDAGSYFSASALKAQVKTALQNPLLPEQAFAGTGPQSRWMNGQNLRYWGLNPNQPLPLGQIVSPPLLWQGWETAFTPGMIVQDFETRLTDAMVSGEGGYVQEGAFWWRPTNVATYDTAARFYSLISVADPFGNTTTISYDPSCLLMTAVQDAIGNLTTIVNDYQSLSPAKITDINGIAQQALYDPLGNLLVRSVHGVINGTAQGDGDLSAYTMLMPTSLADVMTNPQTYLQNATEYFYRDNRTWNPAAPQPLGNAHLSRQVHLSNPNPALPITQSVVYFDGQARTLQTKTLVEGAAIGQVADAWITSGRIVYDNKGQLVRTYLPEISQDFIYEPTTGSVFDTVYYDPIGRETGTLSAKGFITRIVYKTWSETTYDQDDLVQQSPYYQANINNHDPHFAFQREALAKAAVFEDTPTTQHVDPRRITIQTDRILVSTTAPGKRTLSTTFALDAWGRIVTTADPRFSAWNSANPQNLHYNTQSFYDMGDTPLKVVSCDTGVSRSFHAADDELIENWTAKEARISRAYDALRRPLTISVKDTGLDHIVEAFAYGTDASANLNGRLLSHHDQAGILSFSAYNLDGMAVATSRQMLQQAGVEVNWNPGQSPALEPALSITSSYTIDGRILTETGPDGSVSTYGYYRTGWLASQQLTLAGQGQPQNVLTSVTYDARGQREVMSYGNGTVTTRAYEDTTGRILQLTTIRTADSKALQDIGYVYDPVGNITEIIDNSVNDVATGHDLIDPGCAFTYDSLYRLITSTGRQSPDITSDSYHDGFMGTGFVHLNDTSKLIGYSESYTYDDSGNPLQLVHKTSSGTGNFTRDYTVSPTSNHSVPTGMVSPTTPPDSFYDANGNMNALPYVQALIWSYRNTLAGNIVIARQGGPNDGQSFLYDSEGLRAVSVTDQLVNGTTGTIDRRRVTTFGRYRQERRESVDQAGKVTVVSSSWMVKLALSDNLTLTAQHWDQTVDPKSPNPQWRYQYTTDLGSIALELDGAAQIVSYEEYFAFGGSAFIAGLGKVEVSGKVYRYSGKERDTITGLYYYGVRYYASWLGRWLSADPLGPVDGLNFYEFVGNNPVSYVDPTGSTKQPSGSNGKGGQENIPPQPTTASFFRSLISNATQPYTTPFEMVRARLQQNQGGGGGGQQQPFYTSPLFGLFASGAFTISQMPALFGFYVKGHAAQYKWIPKILEEGLKSNYGGSGLTPGSSKPSTGPAKSWPEAAARGGKNRVFVGNIISTIIYANQVALKEGGKEMVSRGIFSFTYLFNPLIDPRRIVPFLLPQSVLNRFHQDPDSIIRIFDPKRFVIPGMTHPYNQEGFARAMPNTALFGGLRSEHGFDLSPSYSPRSQHFNMKQFISQLIGELHITAQSNPWRFARGIVGTQAGLFSVIYFAGRIYVQKNNE
jgi:RHS repeat-associated protein